MSKQRPVNLDLFTIKQPLPAIASIIHRITGLVLFFGIAILIYILDQTLQSEVSFASISETLSGGFVKLVIWGILSALIYHFVAGIKHLLMDFGIGETLEGGMLGAKLTIGISAVLILIAGISIW